MWEKSWKMASQEKDYYPAALDLFLMQSPEITKEEEAEWR